MIITLDIPNKQLFEKILWLLNRFKNDGVKIIVNDQKNNSENKKNNYLKQFKEVTKTKSKDSIKISERIILSPHDELKTVIFCL